MPTYEILEERQTILQQRIEDLQISGQDIKSNNSYSDSSTGHNQLSDVEYTDEYLRVSEELEKVENQIINYEDLPQIFTNLSN